MNKTEKFTDWLTSQIESSKKLKGSASKLTADLLTDTKKRLDNDGFDKLFSYVIMERERTGGGATTGMRIIHHTFNQLYAKMWSLNREEEKWATSTSG